MLSLKNYIDTLAALGGICTIISIAFRTNSPGSTAFTTCSGSLTVLASIMSLLARKSFVCNFVISLMRYVAGAVTVLRYDDIEIGNMRDSQHIQPLFAVRPRLRNVGVVVPSGANSSFTLTVVRRRRPRSTGRMSEPSSRGDHTMDPLLASLSGQTSPSTASPPPSPPVKPPLSPQQDYANPVSPPTREDATHNRQGAGNCKNGDNCRFPHVLPDNPLAAANQYFGDGRHTVPRDSESGDSLLRSISKPDEVLQFNEHSSPMPSTSTSTAPVNHAIEDKDESHVEHQEASTHHKIDALDQARQAATAAARFSVGSIQFQDSSIRICEYVPLTLPYQSDSYFSTGYTTLLNNHFRKLGQDPTVLSYAESVQGPSDKAVWTVVCKVNGEARGMGVAGTRAAAKGDAARQAYQATVGE
ncbi:hypothetical protein Moror_5528 [Moniliophthora roreri MCA 2997]|uniref:C3H1-type domain-containing protein n=1 Tax=Moniliophthora roreri (strain MCA 2997) TaxID=1381753 RepID=V2X344_MONRO|nr:hypothetical protein Moror_5528 [Moniliophthora roreri MCA 2997]